MKFKALIFIFFIPIFGWSQLPISQLYGIKLSGLQDTVVQVESVQLLSQFNQGGYNNQPELCQDGMLLTIAEKGDDQTDICRLHLDGHQLEYLTSTRLYSEYSPKLFKEDSAIYCIRVDSAGIQNVWAFPLDLSHGGENVLHGIDNAGYYQRINQDSFVVFLTGQPHQLAIASRSKKDKYVFTSNVGRTFYYRDGLIYFVHKLTPATWYLKKYDLNTRKSIIVARMPDGVEDFWLESNEIWLGKGGIIHRLKMDIKQDWQKVVDLTSLGISNITRMVMNGDQMMIVNKISE